MGEWSCLADYHLTICPVLPVTFMADKIGPVIRDGGGLSHALPFRGACESLSPLICSDFIGAVRGMKVCCESLKRLAGIGQSIGVRSFWAASLCARKSVAHLPRAGGQARS